MKIFFLSSKIIISISKQQHLQNPSGYLKQGCSQHSQYQGGQIYLWGVKSVLSYLKFIYSYKIYIKNFSGGHTVGTWWKKDGN